MKNTIAAAVMMSALTFGTSVANAGIIMSKSGEAQRCTSTTRNSSLFDKIRGLVLEGIIISKTGIIISKEGIIISKEGSSTCDSQRTREGIIIS